MKNNQKAKCEKRDVASIIGLMDILNAMEVGDSQKFIANNQHFLIIKTEKYDPKS